MEALLRYTGKDIQPIDFDAWLRQKPEQLRPIALKWFESIKNCGPEVQDIFHDNYPIGCVEDAPFAYVNAYTSHVNVGFFYGADLPDQFGLLEGTGKRMRHIKLRPGTEHNDKAILTLIAAAYKDIVHRLNTLG
jgi:hypothetical protein